MEILSFRVYWHDRQENAIEVSTAIYNFIRCLALELPTQNDWYLKSESKKKTLSNKISISQEAIKSILLKKYKTKIKNEKEANEFGFVISFYGINNIGVESSLSFIIGSSLSFSPNNCILDISVEDSFLWNKRQILNIFSKMIIQFNAEFGCVDTYPINYVVKNKNQMNRLGWAFYKNNKIESEIIQQLSLVEEDLNRNFLYYFEKESVFDTETVHKVALLMGLIKM